MKPDESPEVCEQWLDYVETLCSLNRLSDAIKALERLRLEFPDNVRVAECFEKVKAQANEQF